MQELQDQTMTNAVTEVTKTVTSLVTKRVYRQGQTTGRKLDPRTLKLNPKEMRVLSALVPVLGGHRKKMTINDIAVLLNWTKTHGVAVANSWVRNSLRRLVRSGMVEHAEAVHDGTYIITDIGKRKYRELLTNPKTSHAVQEG